MRNYIILQFVLACFAGYTQIPNGSFENWQNGKPVAWSTRSAINDVNPMEYSVTPAMDGIAAAKASIRPITINTQAGPTPTCLVGFLKLADSPINFSPLCLRGYYKLNAADANDVLTIKATVKSSGSIIGVAEFTSSTSSFDFQNFCAIVNYSSALPPTSFEILANLNELRPATATNSYFILDDLTFSSPSFIEENYGYNVTTINPNPTYNNALISIDNSDGENTNIRIINTVGEIMKEIVGQESSFQLQLADLPASIYYVQILQQDKILTTKKLIKL